VLGNVAQVTFEMEKLIGEDVKQGAWSGDVEKWRDEGKDEEGR
jgi:hypothetical protein